MFVFIVSGSFRAPVLAQGYPDIFSRALGTCCMHKRNGSSQSMRRRGLFLFAGLF